MKQVVRFFSLVALAIVAGCTDSTESTPVQSGGDASADSGADTTPWACTLGTSAASDAGGQDAGSIAEFADQLGCLTDFEQLASEPLDASIPGARSVKVVLDQLGGDALYFQNSNEYKIHYEFASSHLSGNGLPIVPGLSEFNRTEYYAPDRRFLLGAVTHYEGADAWALELAPYDTASAAMVDKLYTAIQDNAFFGADLVFHPTSEAIASETENLDQRVAVITTDELFAEIDYQPLNLGEALGRLVFVKADDLDTTYLGFRDIVVLDRVPNDISVVSGMISEEFQTPLSHVNVLAQTRGTPNMGLRGATTNPELLALEGKWVRLTVGPQAYEVEEVTVAEADAYWEEHKPDPVTLPALDTTVTDLRDVEEIVPEGEDAPPLLEAIQTAVRAFGAKTTNYSVLAKLPEVPHREAFGIPVYYYVQFMEQNGFYDRIDELLADPDFQNDPEVRDAELVKLRDDIKLAPVDQDFQDLLRDKLETDFPGLTMRFRSSTNAEDLDGFPCAGCYDSFTGDPEQWDTDLLDAIRGAWAGIWYFRTFEERTYHSIDHKSVAMALLVHHNFPSEEANGVAVTANPFDVSGLEPGFYINVQWGGEAEVVHPPPGVTSDAFIYHYDFPGQPVVYISHSNLIEEGETVLSNAQIHELGVALSAIHQHFAPAYRPDDPSAFYGMDVEFKFDGEPGETPTLFVKQARPFPGGN
jgi:hypothetical protein